MLVPHPPTPGQNKYFKDVPTPFLALYTYIKLHFGYLISYNQSSIQNFTEYLSKKVHGTSVANNWTAALRRTLRNYYEKE
jgi:hypothetical protein